MCTFTHFAFNIRTKKMYRYMYIKFETEGVLNNGKPWVHDPHCGVKPNKV
jgi:hypothetical protein